MALQCAALCVEHCGTSPGPPASAPPPVKQERDVRGVCGRQTLPSAAPGGRNALGQFNVTCDPSAYVSLQTL